MLNSLTSQMPTLSRAEDPGQIAACIGGVAGALRRTLVRVGGNGADGDAAIAVALATTCEASALRGAGGAGWLARARARARGVARTAEGAMSRTQRM